MQQYNKTIFKIIILLLLSISLKAQTVYKTPSGKKYHLANCRMVENVSQAIRINETRDLGLEPCKICKPLFVTSRTVLNKAKGTNLTAQCKGITKKGNRCKHMTSIANGYCFQHNPDN